MLLKVKKTQLGGAGGGKWGKKKQHHSDGTK